MPADLYFEVLDEELADLIEAAFLNGLIDGETQELAYTWLEVNHPCEQQDMTVEIVLLADQVWNKGEIDNQVTWLVWWLIALTTRQNSQSSTKLKR